MSFDIGSTYLDLVKAVSEMTDSDPDCPTLVGADQIKGIYLTGENRTIVGAESDVGIIWEGDGTLFKDENAVTKIADTHFMTRVPIVAGNNVTFETDTENQVVKINSTGGSGTGESSIIDLGRQESHKEAQQAIVDYVISQSAENDCYLFKYWCSCYGNACFAVVRKFEDDNEICGDGTVYDSEGAYREFAYRNGEFTVDGCWLNIASFDEELEALPTEDKSVLGAINEIYQKIGSSSGGTPTKIENGDGSVGVFDTSDIVMSGRNVDVLVSSFYASNEDSDSSIFLNSERVTIEGTNVLIGTESENCDVYIGKYGSEDGTPVGNFYVRSSGTVDMAGGDDVYIEQVSSGSQLFMDSNGDVVLDSDASLTLHNGDDESGIYIVMDDGGTLLRHPNGVHFIGADTTFDIDPGEAAIQSNYIYMSGNAEGEDAVVIEAVNDGNIDIVTNGGNLRLYTKNTCGNAGQVLMSDGEYAYWGDVEGSSGGGSPMTPITYAELKALRDSGKLVAGMFYRITDYVCTTTQAETRAMNNRFDIIVQALSNNTLSETAKADYNAEDNYFKIESGGNALVEGSVTKYYDIYEDCDTVEDKTENYKSNDTFVEYGYLENNEGVTVPVLYKNDLDSYADEGADYGDIFYYVGTYAYEGTTYDRWRKIESGDYGWDGTGKIYALTNVIVENNEIISSVKAGGIKYNANLPAWELKYCLDNDTTRFAWADETNGKGVIYFMKDEHGNECPYDFKNIQFKRMVSLENGYPELDTENGTETWVYTFCGNSYHIDNDTWSELKDGSLESPYQHQSDEYFSTFRDNVMGTYYLIYDEENEDATTCGKQYLNNNVFFGWWEERNSTSPDDRPSYYSYCCFSNNLGKDCRNNTFAIKCNYNVFGDNCKDNILKESCYSNIYGTDCTGNSLDNSCSGNIFGRWCTYNILGSECSDNNFGGHFGGNTLLEHSSDNVFGGSNSGCSFGTWFNQNTIEKCVSLITVEGTKIRYIRVLQGVEGKTLTPVAMANYAQIFKPTGTVETEV